MKTPSRTVAASLTALVAGLSIVPLWALERQQATAVASVLHLAALVVALVAMVRSARRSSGQVRRVRSLLALSLSAVAAGNAAGLAFVLTQGSVPVPSLADLLTLMWVPLAVAGFWLVPTREGEAVPTSRRLADAAVATSALLLASWLLFLEPMLESGRWSSLGLATQLAYPVSDAVVAAMVLSLLPRARADMRPLLNVVAAGLVLIAISDSGAALLLAERGVVAFGWPDVTLQAGMCLLAYAALRPGAPVMTPARRAGAVDGAMPFLPIGIAVVVGLRHMAVVGPFELDEGVLGALMVLAIVVRQIVYTRELGAAAERHRYDAAHDELTGLLNRKAFLERLSEHVSTPGSPPAAVLLADLDGFKEVNDSFGHECGDVLLARFAGSLCQVAGTSVTARLGGDEFAVLVVDQDPEAAALELARRLGSSAPQVDSVLLPCSIGIAGVRPDDAAIDVLRRADLAMYTAKRDPMSPAAVFTDAMSEQSDRRNLLLAALPGAVARGEMSLAYQPLYRLADHTIYGVESLLRWTHPLFGAVPPDEFIPLAEDGGHICGLGGWVLDAALGQLASWEAEGRVLGQLFVNVAAAQFSDELPAQVAAALRRHHVPAERLTLEITESELPGLAANRAISALRQAGVLVALDDFGSGYSSFAQLGRLPVDVLKIDRDVISNLDTTAGVSVLDAVVGLAKALGLATVAEGIETAQQAAVVADRGVDYGQGYLWCRPLPPDELLRLLPACPEQPTSALPLPRPDAEPGARSGCDSRAVLTSGSSMRRA